MPIADNDTAERRNTNAKWCIALHGGNSGHWQTDPERQHEIEKVLHSIALSSGKQLSSGSTALDVVQSAVAALEDCPLFNAGVGSALTIDGKHELEAAIVDGSTKAYGAVACCQNIQNPINAARAVADSKRHVFLIGPGADDFAQKNGLQSVPNNYFTTPLKLARWENSNNKHKESTIEAAAEDHDTVGAIALDMHGRLAAAASTGGTSNKMSGRLGDAAVIGAGLLADEDAAILCGAGEEILRNHTASKVAFYHKTMPLDDAVRAAILDVAEMTTQPCGIVALNAAGEFVFHSSGRVFATAISSSTSNEPVASLREGDIALLPRLTIYHDPLVSAGLSRFPVAPGQTELVLNGSQELTSLNRAAFVQVMVIARQISSSLCTTFNANRCGFISNGSGLMSLIPLHGVDSEWKAVIHEAEEYHDKFPGYLTTKNGPKMTDESLNLTCSRITSVTGLSSPHNMQFNGEPSDNNLFARIIRGELSQWRVWEDAHHVAFLTPFGNVPGFTVLVPRKHLSSDIFSLNDQDYADLLGAAHDLAQSLKVALNVKRCGIFLEGFEIDYAHVKLIPVHEDNQTPVCGSAEYSEVYPGYLTSQSGPLELDFQKLRSTANSVKKVLEHKRRIMASKTWENPATHPVKALDGPWYGAQFAIQSTLVHGSLDYFRKHGYKYTLVPITTDGISSPMGLGSDSEPVAITLHGRDTYLADSMQFNLEYALRLEDDLPGAYYVGCSVRGEDIDKTHINQFFHIECELLGNLDDGITIAEGYIETITKTLLQKHEDLILNIAGSTSHIESLLRLLQSNGGKFPRITLDKALALPEMVEGTSKLVCPNDAAKGRTLTRQGERILINKFGGAVWLTEMDHLSVPFYQAYADEGRSKALCADLLFGLGEVLGLGERHCSADQVLESLTQHEVSPEPYSWYIDMRKVKELRTTGWGMGMERFLCWLLQHDDIRDISIIPRFKGLN